MSTLERKRRFEIASSGFDEYLSLVGGDPFGGSNSVGLRIPTLPTPTILGGGAQLRYLFNLASFTVGEGACVRIRGYRQLLTIGATQQTPREGPNPNPIYVIEQEVVDPFWRFNDGNVSWHLHVMGNPNASDVPRGVTAPYTDVARDVVSYKRYWADSPALLYGPGSGVAPGNIYTNIASYVPPNNGKPYGSAINAAQGTFYDLRIPWRDSRAWDALDIPVEGPATVAFFASVRQTNPSTRNVLAIPSFAPGGISTEEAFLTNFANAIYWRVGGSLIVEEA
jgi:hypothetical protein